jgi:KDO2-lipid IV(A) lauroyltransferase
VVPHFGSWEFGGMAMAQTGLPLLVIAGKQRNPLFDDYLTASRKGAGIEIVMRGASTLRKVISRLKEGRFMAVVADVRMPTPGVKVQFLGREANVGPGMAQFARHAGVPIIPALNIRHGWARHEGVVFPPIEPDPLADKTADIQRMTQAVFDIFTEAIRRDPGQWFWYNKRWLFDPVV